jgi:hypothetical protein
MGDRARHRTIESIEPLQREGDVEQSKRSRPFASSLTASPGPSACGSRGRRPRAALLVPVDGSARSSQHARPWTHQPEAAKLRAGAPETMPPGQLHISCRSNGSLKHASRAASCWAAGLFRPNGPRWRSILQDAYIRAASSSAGDVSKR